MKYYNHIYLKLVQLYRHHVQVRIYASTKHTIHVLHCIQHINSTLIVTTLIFCRDAAGLYVVCVFYMRWAQYRLHKRRIIYIKYANFIDGWYSKYALQLRNFIILRWHIYDVIWSLWMHMCITSIKSAPLPTPLLQNVNANIAYWIIFIDKVIESCTISVRVVASISKIDFNKSHIGFFFCIKVIQLSAHTHPT